MGAGNCVVGSYLFVLIRSLVLWNMHIGMKEVASSCKVMLKFPLEMVSCIRSTSRT